jgi:hypothetical protein
VGSDAGFRRKGRYQDLVSQQQDLLIQRSKLKEAEAALAALKEDPRQDRRGVRRLQQAQPKIEDGCEMAATVTSRNSVLAATANRAANCLHQHLPGPPCRHRLNAPEAG